MCKMFREICSVNFLWYHSYKFTFPVLHEEKSLKKDFAWAATSWVSEIQRNYLLLSAFKSIITSMNQNKEKGNEHFKAAVSSGAETRDDEYREALSYYKTSLKVAKQKQSDDEISKMMSNDRTFYTLNYDYLKITVILNSNSAMAHLKLEKWDQAVCAALRGRRELSKLKKLINDDEEFKKDFGTLKEKIEYRMIEARKN